jgi:hypothetical protein
MSDSETDVDGQRQMLKSLWRPHPGQRAVMDSPARFRIVAAGRRWGKSSMCAHEALEYALETPESTVWWVSPSYQQSNEYGFDKMTPLLSPDVLADEPKRSEPREIPIDNGSTISFRSADREDSLRGGGVDLLVIDEAGSVPERAWTEELRPALSDTLGDMIAIGTPRGRNWFYRWFQRGQSSDHPDVASWQAPTAQSPHLPDSEVEDARGDMPDRAFEQEYEAAWIDDTGGVFEDVRERNVETYDLPVAPEDSDGPYAIGVDFARMSDWTVVIVLDDTGRVVAFERLRQTTWTRIQDVVERLADEYTPNKVALDATRDNKIVQDLRESVGSVDPVRFSASNKRTLIENLITMMEAREIVLSSEANQLINELEVFEYDMNESGTVSYDAPSGFRDDCVDALALAADARTNDSGGVTRTTRSGLGTTTGSRRGSSASNSNRRRSRRR